MKPFSCVKMADRFTEVSENDLTSLVDQKNSDRMIKQSILCNDLEAFREESSIETQ